jgi:hypothetical protein
LINLNDVAANIAVANNENKGEIRCERPLPH